MPVDISKMKKGQDAIRQGLASIEENIAAKKAEFSGLYDEEELRDMMNVLLKQNQKLERRVEYLLNVFTEFAKSSAEGPNEKLLSAMAQSQIEVLEQLAALQEKAEAGAPTEEIKKAQEEMLKSLNAQMKTVSDTLSNMPYQQQMELLKKDIAAIAEEMRDIEALVTTEAPEQVMLSINSLKADSDELRKRVDGLNNELARIEKGEEALLPQVAAIKEMQGRLAEIDLKLMGLADIGEKIATLANEIDKLEHRMETYPASAAQEIRSLKETVKAAPEEGPLKAAYEELQQRLASMEKDFKARELDVESRRSAEMKVILKLLEKTEKQLLENEEASGKFKASVAALEQKAKALEGKAGPDVAAELPGLETHISQIESELEKESHIESTHVNELLEGIREARSTLRSALGQQVDPEAMAGMKEAVAELEMPAARIIEPEHRESIAAAEAALAGAAEAASKKEKKALEEAGERVATVREEIEKTGEAAQEAKAAVAGIIQQANEIAVSETKTLTDYIARMPPGKTIALKAIASELNMSLEGVEHQLLEMQKQGQPIELRDAGYGARLLGKEATLTKK